MDLGFFVGLHLPESLNLTSGISSGSMSVVSWAATDDPRPADEGRRPPDADSDAAESTPVDDLHEATGLLLTEEEKDGFVQAFRQSDVRTDKTQQPAVETTATTTIPALRNS